MALPELINLIDEYKKIREIYKQQYPQHKKSIKILDKKFTIKSESTFTFEELKKLSLTIGLDYHPMAYKFKGGIPGGLYMMTQPSLALFENMDIDLYKIPIPRPDKEISKYVNLPLSERINHLFLDCVDFIFSMNIEIYSIDINLKNYHPNVSSCCGGCDVFIFHCKKNELTFDFEYFCDCDYADGFLYCASIFNTISQIDIKIGVSFDISNLTSTDYKNEKFHFILNGNVDFKDYYGHIMVLPELLSQHFTIVKTDIPEYFFDCQIDVYYNPSYYITIFFKNRYCCLTPGHHVVYLSDEPLKTIDDGYVFKYKNVDDLNKIISCIKEYINRNHGYGYLEQAIYYNDQDVKREFGDLNIDVAKDIDNLSGFDVFMVLNDDDIDDVWTENRMNTSYKIAHYGIRLMYNKNIDSNCILTISCIGTDAIQLANEYDEDEYKNVYDNRFKPVMPLITIHESYSACIMIIKTLKELIKK